ncbi:MAG: hypothetical protein FJ405_18705 [Verrucomicrobia bacterium]|nr:hypothetical protein [Verrucomicrobiota bacterium]
MNFALVQETLERPSVEALQRAFQMSKIFTSYDAHILSKDAFGILARRLTREQAMQLTHDLARAGITGVRPVEERALPQTPPAKILNKLECHPDCLRIFDAIGRPIDVAWGHLWLVTSGQVMESGFERKSVPIPSWNQAGPDGVPIVDTEVRVRERLSERMVLDLVLRAGVIRYSLNLELFLFETLGERRTGDLVRDLAELIRDFRSHAPGCWLNQGAESLLKQPAQAVSYPSRSAYIEEMIWTLWRMNQSG